MEHLGNPESRDPKLLAKALAQKAIPTRDLVRLPQTERELLISESASDVLGVFRSSGAVEFSNVTKMYDALRGENMFVRRENPSQVTELVVEDTPIQIDFPEGQRYSNAVVWSPSLASRGLQNAYLEGYGQLNSIVTVVGFRGNDRTDVQMLPDAEQTFAGLDRTFVRSVKGEIRPEDVLFVTLRVPSTAFPEFEMTDNEHEAHDAYVEKKKKGEIKDPVFIHRGFLFTQNLEKH